MVFIKTHFYQITNIFGTFPRRKSKTDILVNSQNVECVCKNMKETQKQTKSNGVFACFACISIIHSTSDQLTKRTMLINRYIVLLPSHCYF